MATQMIFGQHTARRRDNSNGSIDWLVTREDGSTITVWYNFTTRDWVVAIECNGGQCGASEYVGRKFDVQYAIPFVSHDYACDNRKRHDVGCYAPHTETSTCADPYDGI